MKIMAEVVARARVLNKIQYLLSHGREAEPRNSVEETCAAVRDRAEDVPHFVAEVVPHVPCAGAVHIREPTLEGR